MTLQDSSRRFRAAGHMDHSLSPRKNIRSETGAQWDLATGPASPPASAAPGLGSSVCRAVPVWLGRGQPCSHCQGDGVSCCPLGLPVFPLPKQGLQCAELDTEREGSLPGSGGFSESLAAHLGQEKQTLSLSLGSARGQWPQSQSRTSKEQGQEESSASRQPKRQGPA